MKNLNIIDREHGKDEWLTPPELVRSLGEFDLDPCSPIDRPWPTAKQHFTILDNGLMKDWFGRVWMNPPYGAELIKWLEKMSKHQNGVSLVFARTETAAFQKFVFPFADSILFLHGRLKFYHVTGKQAEANSGAPSVLVAYGENNSEALASSGLQGAHVPVNTIGIVVIGVGETWRAIVRSAMIRIGGPAPLEKVYDLVESIAPDKVRMNPHFKEKVRQVVQIYAKRIGRGVYITNDN